MPVIQTHDITLYGGGDTGVVLCPLSDAHLPLLYRWNADPEILYWTESGTNDRFLSYPPELVDEIYHGVSQHSLCFLIEAGGVPIGECWLQPMNFPKIVEAYAPANVWRIDMCLGEKAYWGLGLGFIAVRLLVEYAFYGQGVEVLHCFSEDYNTRSWRLWERLAFHRVREKALPQPQKGRFQYEYRLRKQDFMNLGRMRPIDSGWMDVPIDALRPSQAYLSEGKLRLVMEWFDPRNPTCMDPLPVLPLGDEWVLTDGHARAVCAYAAGWRTIPVYREVYSQASQVQMHCAHYRWCRDEGIDSIAALARRIVPHTAYELLWRKRCLEGALCLHQSCNG